MEEWKLIYNFEMIRAGDPNKNPKLMCFLWV